MILNWAIEKEHAEVPELLDTNHREIVWFDILEFLNYVQKPWTIDPDNLTYRNEKKIKKAKEHFSNGGWMDLTDVRGKICDIWPQHASDNRLVIENRHRLLAALQLGEKYAPFSVPLKLVEELKSAVTNVDRV